jgi:hypothetical protein
MSVATVVSLSVPAGRYVVLAKTQLTNTGAGDSVTCTLKSGATTIDQLAVPLQAVTVVATSPTLLTVQRSVLTAGGTADFNSLIAIPTA